MAAITSSVGLISGINTGAIISALINADSIPVSLLQTRINSDTTLNSAYSSIGSQLSALQTTAQSLEQPSTFQAATATSSDPTSVTATAANGAAVGTYNLQVARLVSTQQLISTGFTDSNQSAVGAGTITIDSGEADLTSQTALSDLNGGAGVGRGQFRITDRSGASAVIDTSSAVSLDDVVNDINNSTDISVRASIKNNQLVLTDTSGKNTGNLIVQDLGNGTSAQDLGIVGNVASSTLTGTDINYISSSTELAQLNDGRGVTLGSGNGDFKITTSSGSTVSVNLATAKTVGDVISAINTAGGGKVTASIPTGSTGIKLVDNTTGNGSLSVADTNGSQAAEDLGLNAAASNGTITGKSVLAGLDSTLISSLNGGSGLSLGNVTFTDREGETKTINFSGANNVQDIINDINNTSGLKLRASVKSSGNGIQITDTSNGGTGNITIADANGGTTATELGIAGTYNTSSTSVQGANLHKQWVTGNTLLSSLNGGKGIDKSSFTISTAAGASTTIDLSGSNVTTVNDLLYQINSKGIAGLSASINSDGNGIVVNDASGGAGKLTIADTDGTAAEDLIISGSATGTATSINGAYEKTLTVSANDTLSTVEQNINNLNFGVHATIINDGSSTAPYRLSLTADNSGTAGGVSLDTGSTNLGAQTLVAAQDAAVFVGNSNTSEPLLVTSSTNQISNVIQGVTLSLTGVSTGTVQVNVAQDTSGISTALSSFVTAFNTLSSNISSQSTFNSTTNQAGLLLGDPVAQQVTSTIYNVLNTIVKTAGNYQSLASIGITVGSNGQLAFNQDTFNQAIATDPNAVENLFNASTTTTDPTTKVSTTTNTGVAYAIDTAINQLTAPINGIVTSAETELTNESQGFSDQITQLNALLAQKQAQLQEEFNNMETVLAGLKSQSASIGSISTVSVSGSSSSSSSNSSSSSTG
jgi:flagellar hook-associated protein 2